MVWGTRCAPRSQPPLSVPAWELAGLQVRQWAEAPIRSNWTNAHFSISYCIIGLSLSSHCFFFLKTE